MDPQTRELTKENLADIVQKGGIVLIDWWAAWCGPCRAFAPTYASVAAKHPDVVFGKVDTEAEPAIAGAFQIRAIPTLMVFRDGILLFRESGALPASALEELLRTVRALDMTDVRKQMEAERAEAMSAEAKSATAEAKTATAEE